MHRSTLRTLFKQWGKDKLDRKLEVEYDYMVFIEVEYEYLVVMKVECDYMVVMEVEYDYLFVYGDVI